MKRNVIYICVVLVFLLLSSCGFRVDLPDVSGTVEPSDIVSEVPSTQSPDVQSPEPSESPSVSEPPVAMQSAGDYFPVASNTKYNYIGEGNEYASFVIFNDYTKKKTIQQSIDNGGVTAARVIEIQDGAVVSVYIRGEAYFRENLLEAKGTEEILLMDPIEIGTTWNLDDTSVRKITGVSVDVTTPSGNYVAVEVLTEMKDGRTVDYYALGVGLVKTVYTSEDTVVTSMLSSVEMDVARHSMVTFFYPASDESIKSLDAEVSFATNDITRKVLERAYRSGAGDDMLPVLTENTEINSLYLNSDGMVYLDLNAAFLQEMNAGSSHESRILRCVANTFGMYYNADKVILTIDGGLYSSGHFAFEAGEYIEVVPLEELFMEEEQSELPEGMVAIIDEDEIPLSEELLTIKPLA